LSKLNKVFLTGCDRNAEWMLEWFLKHYRKHNTTPIIFADFGCSMDMRAKMHMLGFSDIFAPTQQQVGGWFYKPRVMLQAAELADEVCWLDTDIHIKADMSGIFSHIENEKLTMCEDRGWSSRRGEKWHNSGVVAFRGKPNILKQWAEQCTLNPKVGDQEVLHEMVNESPLTRMKYITDAPAKYNWLRLDVLDGRSGEIAGMHWTGYKGKLEIKRLMYNE